jgi:ankyrin repeat protein
MRAARAALMSAAWEGHTQVVKLLLQKHADMRPKNGRGETALSLAESAGNREVAALLRGAR